MDEKLVQDSVAKLLPCPFCGGTLFNIKENGKIWMGQGWGAPVSISIVHYCELTEGQPSRSIERVGRDLESAIQAWNMRYVDKSG